MQLRELDMRGLEGRAKRIQRRDRIGNLGAIA